jgi:hypothetical protein
MDTIARRARATVVLALASLAMGGCDEKAREFATRAQQLLTQRSEQLAKKIAAEKAAYNSSAAHAAEDHRALVDSSLQNERNERSEALAADYAEARRPVSLWRKDLADYAKIDFEANRELLTDDIDASSRYLQTFGSLTIEQDKVNALSKLLAALAKKPSLNDDIAALGTFANEAKTDFDKKICTDLKSRKGDQDDAAKAAQKAYDAKKCDDVLK